MKYCMSCGAQIADGAKFCPKCGSKQAQPAAPTAPQNNSAANEPSLGQYQQPPSQYQQPQQYQPPQPQYQQPQQYQPPQRQYGQPRQQYARPQYAQPTQYGRGYAAPRQKTLLEELSFRIKIVALIWVAVGIFQVVCAIDDFTTAWFWGWVNVLSGIIFLLFGLVNIFVPGYKEYRFAAQIPVYPVGLLEKYENKKQYIGTIVYNVVVFIFCCLSGGGLYIFMGILGVAAGIFDYIWIRQLVMDNAQQLAEEEEKALAEAENQNR